MGGKAAGVWPIVDELEEALVGVAVVAVAGKPTRTQRRAVLMAKLALEEKEEGGQLLRMAHAPVANAGNGESKHALLDAKKVLRLSLRERAMINDAVSLAQSSSSAATLTS